VQTNQSGQRTAGWEPWENSRGFLGGSTTQFFMQAPLFFLLELKRPCTLDGHARIMCRSPVVCGFLAGRRRPPPCTSHMLLLCKISTVCKIGPTHCVQKYLLAHARAQSHQSTSTRVLRTLIPAGEAVRCRGHPGIAVAVADFVSFSTSEKKWTKATRPERLDSARWCPNVALPHTFQRMLRMPSMALPSPFHLANKNGQNKQSIPEHLDSAKSLHLSVFPEDKLSAPALFLCCSLQTLEEIDLGSLEGGRIIACFELVHTCNLPWSPPRVIPPPPQVLIPRPPQTYISCLWHDSPR
jgi:hypothetical protein